MSDRLGKTIDRAMNELSPAQRVRRTSMVVGSVVSSVTFVLLANEIVVSQLLEGYASLLYVLGTACVIAGASLLLFAIILAIGLVVSIAFNE